MTSGDLFREIGNISEEYVVEAENYRKQITGVFKVLKNPSFRKTLATAACLVVCLGLAVTVQKMGIGEDSAAESAREGNTGIFEMAADEAPAAQEAPAASEELTEDAAPATDEGAVPEDAPETEASMAPEAALEEEEGAVEDSGELEKGEDSEDPPGGGNASGAALGAEKEGGICNYPTASEEQREEAVTESEDWDAEAVRERLAEYPDDYQDILTQDNAFIIAHGEVKAGQQTWEDFRKHVDADEPTQIDIIRFTIEGDPIIEVVYYDGEIFHLLVDNSRDAYRGSGDAYYEASYKYMQRSEQELEGGRKSVEYMLTNSESESYSIAYLVE